MSKATEWTAEWKTIPNEAAQGALVERLTAAFHDEYGRLVTEVKQSCRIRHLSAAESVLLDRGEAESGMQVEAEQVADSSGWGWLEKRARTLAGQCATYPSRRALVLVTQPGEPLGESVARRAGLRFIQYGDWSVSVETAPAPGPGGAGLSFRVRLSDVGLAIDPIQPQ